jgi:hypothetical protein
LFIFRILFHLKEWSLKSRIISPSTTLRADAERSVIPFQLWSDSGEIEVSVFRSPSPFPFPPLTGYAKGGGKQGGYDLPEKVESKE